MIVLQEMVTTWTKASRGGESATARNAVPESFLLPALLAKPKTSNSVLYQRVMYSEQRNFQRPIINMEFYALLADEWLQFTCTWLRMGADGLEIEWKWNRQAGTPERGDSRR